MKSKHLTGDAYPLTLHEMLEECAQNQTVSKSIMLCMTNQLQCCVIWEKMSLLEMAISKQVSKTSNFSIKSFKLQELGLL